VDEADASFDFGSPVDAPMHDESFADPFVGDLSLGSDLIDLGLHGTPMITAPEDDARIANQGSSSDDSLPMHTSDTGEKLVDFKIGDEEDEFAELDAWFASGAVEIV
jgi:hypothetical protein